MNYMALNKSLEYGFEEKKLLESQMRPLKDYFSGTLEEKVVFISILMSHKYTLVFH